eukprot:1034045-Rhodomonas_salina.1
MFSLLFDLNDYSTTYRATRDSYLKVGAAPHAVVLHASNSVTMLSRAVHSICDGPHCVRVVGVNRF